MPIAEDPDRPGWRVLLDDRGTPAGRFMYRELEGTRFADLAEGRPEVMLAELRGWIVAGDEPLGRALLDRGAVRRRHARVLSRALPARGVRTNAAFVPADRPAADLMWAHEAAFPPGHPDPPVPDVQADLAALLAGDLLGPLLPCSALALAADGRVIGGVLVNAAPGEPPFGGPWLADLFRHPRFPGTGRALLEHALACLGEDGHATIGLAVTVGNRAESLYRGLGFREVVTSLSVWIPPR